MLWVWGLFCVLISNFAIAADGDFIPPVIPNSFPVTILEGLSFPKEYRGRLYSGIDGMDRESMSGRRIYLKPWVAYEKALNREPLELDGVDGRELAAAVSRWRLGKDALYEMEGGGFTSAKPEGFQVVVANDRVSLYLTVTVSELRNSERGPASTSERSMRIPFQDIADHVLVAKDAFQSDEPWTDNRFYLGTEDEKLIPVKIVGRSEIDVWVVITSEFERRDATELQILRVRTSLLRRVPQGEVPRIVPRNLFRPSAEWLRLFHLGAPFKVPALGPSDSLADRFKALQSCALGISKAA